MIPNTDDSQPPLWWNDDPGESGEFFNGVTDFDLQAGKAIERDNAKEESKDK
jgi:hypothetical protein